MSKSQGDHEFDALRGKLGAVVADRHRVALAVEVDKAEFLAQHPAFFVDDLDRKFGAAQTRLVEWRLNAREA